MFPFLYLVLSPPERFEMFRIENRCAVVPLCKVSQAQSQMDRPSRNTARALV